MSQDPNQSDNPTSEQGGEANAENPKQAPARRRFRLHPLTVVLLLLAAALAVLADATDTAATPETIGRLTGMFAAVVLIPLGLGWLVSFLSRHRRWAGNITVVLVALLVMLGQLGQRGQQANALDRLDRAMREARQKRAELVQQMQQGKSPVHGMSQRLETRITTIEEVASDSHGPVKAALTAMAQTFHKLLPAAREYEQAFARIQKAGMLMPGTLDSRETINERIELFEQFGEANNALDKAFASIDARLLKRLQEADIEEARAKKLVAKIRKTSSTTEIRRLRELDRRLVERSIKMLNLLKDNYQKWQYDPEGKQIVFSSDALLKKHNQAFKQIQRIGEKQRNLIKQIAAQIGSE